MVNTKFKCTVLLPPGVNPIAVNKYIKYQRMGYRRKWSWSI